MPRHRARGVLDRVTAARRADPDVLVHDTPLRARGMAEDYSCNVFSGSEDLHVCISWSFGRLPPAVQLYIQVVTHCAWRRLVYRIAGAMLHFSTVLS